MHTPLRFARFTLVAAVAVATLGMLVLPGMATATSSGAPERPVPSTAAPATASIEPAWPAVVDGTLDAPAVRPSPAVQPPASTARPAPDPKPRSTPAGSADPNGSVSSPVMPYDPGYWTPERMANAKPAPMPTVP